jgi:hypothetical protein
LIVAPISDGYFIGHPVITRVFYQKYSMNIFRVRGDSTYERATQDAAEVIQAYVDLAGSLPAGSRDCEAYLRSALTAFDKWRDQALRLGQLQQADERRLLEILAQDH